jgi:transcriptional regulator with XRE-family HTH domain
MLNDLGVIGRRLRQVRVVQGVSQQIFGEMGGLKGLGAKVQVCQYEHGTHFPSYGFVLEISEFTKIPEYFFYIKDDELAERLLEALESNNVLEIRF